MPRSTKPLTQQTVTKRPPRASAAQALVLARLAHGWRLAFVNCVTAHWLDEAGVRRGLGFMPSINGLWQRNLLELGDRADESTPEKSVRFFTLTHAGKAAVPAERICLRCGCTEAATDCLVRTGFWSGPNLCSACQEV